MTTCSVQPAKPSLAPNSKRARSSGRSESWCRLLCYADGRLYLHGESGELALVEATPEGYREKGRFTPPDQPERGQSKAWAYPVVANGRFYIRDSNVLWCYDVKEPRAASR